MGEMLSLEQKIGRFKFPILRVYQLQMVADVKRRRFYNVCKRIT